MALPDDVRNECEVKFKKRLKPWHADYGRDIVRKWDAAAPARQRQEQARLRQEQAAYAQWLRLKEALVSADEFAKDPKHAGTITEFLREWFRRFPAQRLLGKVVAQREFLPGKARVRWTPAEVEAEKVLKRSPPSLKDGTFTQPTEPAVVTNLNPPARNSPTRLPWLTTLFYEQACGTKHHFSWLPVGRSPGPLPLACAAILAGFYDATTIGEIDSAREAVRQNLYRAGKPARKSKKAQRKTRRRRR